MLLKLSIKNYILIHDLEIDFSSGFSVITGETGAGKSILLGALSLILGLRADSGILLDKSQKCIIEGLFAIRGYNLEQFFADNELDYDDSIILRREINQHGKSRAFINDSPVNLALMKDLGDRLVNVHSQNSIITLNDSNFQLAVVDSYAGIQQEVTDFRLEYNKYVELQRELTILEEKIAKIAGEKDYYQFLLDELNQARPVAGEFQEIKDQLELLTHAEEIRASLYGANQLISGTDQNILVQLSDVAHVVGNIARFKPELQNLAERINVNYIDIKDIASELNTLEEQIFVDPERMETLTQRHDLLYRLMKKHQVTDIDELLTVKQGLEQKVFDEAGMEEQVNNLRSAIALLKSELTLKAISLTKKRQKVVPGFEAEVTQILTKLGIAMARFSVEMTSSTGITRDGTDKVRFLFSANKGIDMKELSNVASGGEQSRLMLAIKSMISQKNLLPTIIFDEIDNGVSGEVAGKVAGILKKMGTQMQVIAISHLPQIAARGDRHYWVYKTEKNQVATTYIKQLTAEERVGEIAKMLSSETVTGSAIMAARELLDN
jgi:DNA repair protein RecN (Recombination protein N)